MKSSSKFSSAFSLMEILLVIAIIMILAAISIVAINPGRQLATARNRDREVDINAIHGALKQYYYDNLQYPDVIRNDDGSDVIGNCGNNCAICKFNRHTEDGGQCTGVDLDLLVPSYLGELPEDPNAADENYTGYYVYRDPRNGDISLLAPGSEDGEVIAINPPTSQVSEEATLPVGTIVAFAGSGIPTGWLELDGSAISRTTYSDLFSLTGTTYGNGDGSSTFNLPDLQGRTPFGAGEAEGLSARTLGEESGSEETSGIPAVSTNAQEFSPGPDKYLAKGLFGGRTAAPLYNTLPANSSLAGTMDDSNMSPFITLKYIVNHANSDVPAGAVGFLSSSSIPTGWQELDGDEISRGDYSELFTVIGTTYGIGDGSTTFKLPDLRGRSVLGEGSGSGLTDRQLGDIGGSEITSGIPAISGTRAQWDVVDPNYTISDSQEVGRGGYHLQFATGTPDTSLAGELDDGNMPPFIALTPIIKVNSSSQIPVGLIVGYVDSAAPATWTIKESIFGRMILGKGNAQNLSARALNETGGGEITSGIPAISTAGTAGTVGPTYYLSTYEGHNMYEVGPADTSLAGELEDSNMPPFVVISYIEFEGSSMGINSKPEIVELSYVLTIAIINPRLGILKRRNVVK